MRTLVSALILIAATGVSACSQGAQNEAAQADEVIPADTEATMGEAANDVDAAFGAAENRVDALAEDASNTIDNATDTE